MALQTLGKRESLSDQAYKSLREAVLTGELAPGEVLAEEHLAEMLGISRTPIRAALQQLIAEKLAETDARGRVVVTDVIDSDVCAVDQVRLKIEPLSAQLSAERGLTPEQAEELRSYCRAQRQAADEGDIVSFFDYGYRFHNRLAEMSGNSFLAEMIGRASMTAVRYLMKSDNPARYIDRSGEEHEYILEKVISRDSTGAAQAMERHILDAEPSFLTIK